MQLLQQVGPGLPPDVLKRLLAVQQKSGKLPLEGLKAWQLGRGGAGVLRNPGRGRFFDEGGSRFGAVGGFFNHFPDDPSRIGDTSNSPVLGGGPPGPTQSGDQFRSPAQGGDPFSSPYASDQGTPNQVINPAGRGAGYMSNTGSSYTGVSGLTNPAATPSTNQSSLDALARYMMNLKMSSGGSGSRAYQAF